MPGCASPISAVLPRKDDEGTAKLVSVFIISDTRRLNSLAVFASMSVLCLIPCISTNSAPL